MGRRGGCSEPLDRSVSKAWEERCTSRSYSSRLCVKHMPRTLVRRGVARFSKTDRFSAPDSHGAEHQKGEAERVGAAG